jgi:HNH endonuclease
MATAFAPQIVTTTTTLMNGGEPWLRIEKCKGGRLFLALLYNLWTMKWTRTIEVGEQVMLDPELQQKLFNSIEEQPGPLDTPCWIWTKCTARYGRVAWKGQTRDAHRLSYIAFIGPIPDGFQVNHHCDAGHCIRPDHLYLGTQRHNIEDKYRRGRANHASGEANGMAVITEAQAAEIKYLALEGQLSQQEIADLYGVVSTTVTRIKSGELWRWVPNAPPPPPPVQPFHRRI